MKHFMFTVFLVGVIFSFPQDSQANTPIQPVCPDGFIKSGDVYKCTIQADMIDDYEVSPVCPLGFIEKHKIYTCTITPEEIIEF